MAAKAGLPDVEPTSFAEKQSRLLADGFSFSGYERDGLFLNLGKGQYENISGVSGIDSISDGRGAICADFDNDGDTDVFLTNIQNQAFQLFRNNVGSKQHYLRVLLQTKKGARDAFGAVVRLGVSKGTLTKIKSGGSGYLAQHDPRLLFGLGQDEQASYVDVRWPSGAHTHLKDVPANCAILIEEGSQSYTRLAEEPFSLPDPVNETELKLSKLKIQVGAPFPDLALNGEDGQSLTFSQIRTKGKLLVNVWATWCVPCRKEMPELQAIYQRKTLDVLGLCLDPELGTMGSFLKRLGISYANYSVGKDALKQVYVGDELFVPVSFLLNEDGTVSEIFTGWSAQIRKRLDGNR